MSVISQTITQNYPTQQLETQDPYEVKFKACTLPGEHPFREAPSLAADENKPKGLTCGERNEMHVGEVRCAQCGGV